MTAVDVGHGVWVGDGPWGALGHIFRRTWERRGFAPQFAGPPTGDVLRFWERSRGPGPPLSGGD